MSEAVHIPGELVITIDHVGIAVPDLDAAVRWYSSMLGMVEVHREVNQEQGVAEAMLGLPGAPDGAALVQLLAPLDPTTTIGKFIERNGPGLQQFAYRVSDLDALSDHLRASGARLLYPEARRGTNNSRINFIHPKDTGGVLIELVEQDNNLTH